MLMSHIEHVAHVPRYGRVNYVLAQRMELLEEVSRLQTSLGVSGDMSYTCETAGYFFLYQVKNVQTDALQHGFVMGGLKANRNFNN